MAEHEVRGLSLEEIDELNGSFAENITTRQFTQGTQLSADVNEDNEFIVYEQQSLEL